MLFACAPALLHVPLFPLFDPPLPSLPSQAVLVRQLGLGTAGEVDGGFVFFVAVDVLEVHHHVEGVGQHQQQDQGRHQAHQDGRRQEGGAVAGRRKLVRLYVEGLDLGGGHARRGGGGQSDEISSNERGQLAYVAQRHGADGRVETARQMANKDGEQTD